MEPFHDSIEHIFTELRKLDFRLRSLVANERGLSEVDPSLKGLVLDSGGIDRLVMRRFGEGRWSASESMPDGIAAISAEIVTRVSESRRLGVSLRLVELVEHFGLCLFEIDVVLLALAVDLEPTFASWFAWLRGDPLRVRPDIELALDLFCQNEGERVEGLRRLGRRATLRRWELLDWSDEPASVPLGLRFLRLEEHVLDFLLGSDEFDPRLGAGLVSTARGSSMSALEQPEELLGIVRQLAMPNRSSGSPKVVWIAVADPGWGVMLAEAIAGEAGLGLLKATNPVAVDLTTLAELLRLTVREARLRDLAFCLELPGELRQTERETISEAIREAGLFVFLIVPLGTQPDEPLGDLVTDAMAVPPIDRGRRTALWMSELGAPRGAEPHEAERLAGAFAWGPYLIRTLAAAERSAAATLGRATWPPSPALWSSCRARAGGRLAGLSRRLEPRDSWDDLVLPPDRIDMLHEAFGLVHYRAKVYEEWGYSQNERRGRGVNLLFAGPSGTGKTLAAEILAGRLGMDAYKVDLAAIVNKYIGETEKRLAQLFEAAEGADAILLFDEADALLGRRTQVRDAHDRYANIQVSYLLQRLEEHQGVVILTTNFRGNLDEAFARRIRLTVEFPIPIRADRKRIWSKAWPDSVPGSTCMDLDFLADRFELTGGNIRNIALTSTFLAAAEGGLLTMKHVVRATAREFQTMGKLLSADDFGRYANDL